MVWIVGEVQKTPAVHGQRRPTVIVVCLTKQYKSATTGSASDLMCEFGRKIYRRPSQATWVLYWKVAILFAST